MPEIAGDETERRLTANARLRTQDLQNGSILKNAEVSP
jgi:hypothetical protein